MEIHVIRHGWNQKPVKETIMIKRPITIQELFEEKQYEEGIVIVNQTARNRGYVLQDGDIVQILPVLYAG